jgi:hypothetical protein
MTPTKWQTLAAQASVEMDPTKLSALMEQLCGALGDPKRVACLDAGKQDPAKILNLAREVNRILAGKQAAYPRKSDA